MCVCVRACVRARVCASVFFGASAVWAGGSLQPNSVLSLYRGSNARCLTDVIAVDAQLCWSPNGMYVPSKINVTVHSCATSRPIPKSMSTSRPCTWKRPRRNVHSGDGKRSSDHAVDFNVTPVRIPTSPRCVRATARGASTRMRAAASTGCSGYIVQHDPWPTTHHATGSPHPRMHAGGVTGCSWLRRRQLCAGDWAGGNALPATWRRPRG